MPAVYFGKTLSATGSRHWPISLIPLNFLRLTSWRSLWQPLRYTPIWGQHVVSRMRKIAVPAGVFTLGVMAGIVAAPWLRASLDQDLNDLIVEAERSASRVSAIDAESQPWGVWSGSLPFESPGDPPARQNLELCLFHLSDGARVFLRQNERWEELKPGSFIVRRIGPSAVMSSVTAGRTPGGGEWVEAWTFATTQSSRDTLLTNASRVVNNLAQSSEVTFSYQGQGVLQRVPRCG